MDILLSQSNGTANSRETWGWAGHRKAASSFHRPQEAVKKRTGESQDGFDKETRIIESQIEIL